VEIVDLLRVNRGDTLTKCCRLPILAQRLLDPNCAAPIDGFEVGGEVGSSDGKTKGEVCWRHLKSANSREASNELNLTIRTNLIDEENYRWSREGGLYWSEKGLGRRVRHRHEYYLGKGLAIRIDHGATDLRSGEPSRVEMQVYLSWYPTENMELQIGYDLTRGQLVHGGSIW
jgi:hypothetical protein